MWFGLIFVLGRRRNYVLVSSLGGITDYRTELLEVELKRNYTYVL